VGGRGGPIEQIFVSPESQPLRVVARARDGSGGIWRSSGANLQMTPLPASRAMAVSPNGQLLATFDGVAGVISSLGSEKAADRRFTVPDVSAATFSGDGKWLVMGSGDPTEYAVLVWDVSSLSEVQRVVVPGSVSTLAISANSKYIAIGSAAGTFVALFQPAGRLALSAGEVRTLACSQAGQTTQLASEEWKKYFADEPIRFTCGAAVSKPSSPPT
jgi:WD40 repeat protein